jgi:hypothetical protein
VNGKKSVKYIPAATRHGWWPGDIIFKAGAARIVLL